MFGAVFEARRSRRAMARATLREISNAIGFATRPREMLEADILGRARRPSPSAGALHPIDILLVCRASRVFRYAPLTHELENLRVADRTSVHAFLEDCRLLVPDAPVSALVLVGDVARVASVYEQPLSLLWRDAGVLLQTLALVTTAYRLAFCPLGILGTPVVEALRLPARAVGVGAALIGRIAE